MGLSFGVGRNMMRAAVLLMVVGCCNLAFANVAATVDPDAVIWTNTAGNIALGWRFFADDSFTITHLGLFDEGDDGLATTHMMGLWRVNKTGGLTLVREAEIGPGLGFSLDHHIFIDIEDFTIVPDPEPWIQPGTGTAYYERWVLGVWSPEDNADPLILRPLDAAVIDAESAGFIHIESQLSKSSDEFTYPWGSQSDLDHFGVNFLYTPVQTVPVPGALLLSVIGLGPLGWGLRRLRA